MSRWCFCRCRARLYRWRLRACGLSRQKQGYARSLAELVMTGALTFDDLPADDEEAIALLTRVKGIGRWSAEIYLLFAEGRRDIWPAGDLAVQIDVGKVMGLAERPSEKICRALAEPWRPYHTHDDKQMLMPGEIYEVDVEIWPQCIVLPKGFRLAVNISGQDFDRPGPSVEAYVPSRGSGPFLHDDPADRPKEVFGGSTTLHTGPQQTAHLLLPIIPKKRGGAVTK